MEFKPRICSSGILVILCIFFLINTCAPTGALGEGEQQQHYKMEEERVNEQPKKPSMWEMTKNAFSLYTSSPLRVPTYLDKSKTLFNQIRAYFFPPNLDFRGSMGNIELEPGSSGGDGAGGKVTEVVGKSFGKSKETVEDSAKSAAKIVGERVQKTKEKVKRSFSGSDKNTESKEAQSEL
ncbi:uncharacterized protein LOC103937164 isoform X1 [Pyrus x bretschneideri]|uniref:uncharacterized protein LOC103937164 isoform X1 n=1 Tax=Pyrus x bretschneideri TaxID=225117 RepID=UPI00202DB8A9|nr:uncharacterized protein LOC103937164 isoform X1 [Pyrus x bretschneideri]